MAENQIYGVKYASMHDFTRRKFAITRFFLSLSLVLLLTCPSSAASAETVTHTAFSRSGRYLLYSFARQLRLWDMSTQKESLFFIEHEAAISSFAVAPDEDHLVLVDDNGGIFVWSIRSAKLVRAHHFSSGNLTVDISADGRWFAVGNRAGKIFIGETQNWQIVKELSAHNFGVKSVRFSPDGRRLFSAGWDQLVQMFDVENPARPGIFFKSGVRGLKAHLGMVNGVSVSPDGSCLLTGAFVDGAGNLSDPPPQDDVLRFWHTETRNPLHGMAFRYGVTEVLFSPDNAQKAYVIDSAGGNFWGAVHELDLAAWKTQALSDKVPSLPGNISAMCVHPSLPVIAFGTSEGRVLLVDERAGKISPIR